MSEGRWRALWRSWIVVGIALELYALARGRMPLTQHARGRILYHPAGSAVAGGFFVWMIWHWLIVAEGTGIGDVVAIVLGALVGLVGFVVRHGQAWRT
jgi:hypothetical protein